MKKVTVVKLTLKELGDMIQKEKGMPFDITWDYSPDTCTYELLVVNDLEDITVYPEDILHIIRKYIPNAIVYYECALINEVIVEISESEIFMPRNSLT